MAEGNGRQSAVSLLGEALRAGIERRALQAARFRADRARVEMQEQIFTDAARYVAPDDDDFVAHLDDQGRALDPQTHTELQKRALQAAYRDLHARGYLANLRRFVVGEGPQITFEVEDERLLGRIEEWTDTFRRLNNWDTLEDEIPVRAWRDGEAFIRYFVHGGGRLARGTVETKVARTLAEAGTSAAELATVLPEAPEGMTLLRLVPPDQITDPAGRVQYGIVTDQDDAQTVLGYCWAPDGQKVREILRIDEVDHLKLNVDSDVLRGRSMLEALLKRLAEHQQWMDYRLTLSFVRTAVALVKTVDGTPAQVTAIRDAQQKSRLDHPANDRKQKKFKPGSTITKSRGVEYEMMTPNLQASDAQHDGRNLLLSMAAGTGLPEYMFTGDASNANYASTMVAESPAVREFEDWQDTFTTVFTAIFRRQLVNGAEAGGIEGLNEDAAREVEVAVEWPPMQTRDELDHAKALQLYQNMGIISREGAALDAGIDWEVERERLEQELQDAVEFTAPVGDEDGEDDDE